MIIKDEFLKKIKDLGLNSYEAKLWVALLSKGVSSAGELSDIANVPRSRSYDVLESLEKKGFVVVKLGKPIKYMAVPPNEVLERVKKKIQNETEVQIKHLNDIKDSEVLTELNSLHSQSIELVDISEKSGSFRGRDNLYDHLELMIKQAENSIIIATSADGLFRKLDFFQRELVKAYAKGVNIKILTEIDKLDDATKKEISEFVTFKDIGDLKARFTIIDEKDILFMLIEDNKIHSSYDIGIWVNSELFCSTLSYLFLYLWKNLDSENKKVNTKRK